MDRVLAVILAGVGGLGLAWLVLTLVGRGGQWNDADGALAVLRLAFLLALALACLRAAAALWSPPPAEAATFRFGRGDPRPAPRNGAPRALPVVFAMLVVGLVGWDFVASGSRPQRSAGDVAPETAVAPAPDRPAVRPPAVAAPPPEVVAAPPVAPAPPEPARGEEPPPADPPATTLAARPETPQTVAPAPPAQLPAPTEAGGHRDSIVWLALSPDGRTIMSASTDFTIKLWDFATRTLIRDVGAHRDMARTALYLPDSVHALTAGDDGDIVLRRLADATVVHVFSSGPNGGARKLALSADGRIAASAHDTGAVVVWDIAARRALHALPGHAWPLSGVAVSPDGRRIVSGSIDGELRLWDAQKGELLRTWKGHERGAYGIVFLGDGRRFVTGSGDFSIKLWSAADTRLIRSFEGHSGTVYAIDVAKDGKAILSGALDGTARLWDLETGRETRQLVGHRGRVYAVAFGPAGTVITGSDDRTIRIWPARTGDQVAVIAGGPQRPRE
jgi:WD40 repeat protein